MKPSEEQRIGNLIIAALERVRRHVCHTGAAAAWHVAKAASIVRKPSLMERMVPQLEGEPVQEYLASLPAWIEETKQQDTDCRQLWSDRQADPAKYQAARERLIATLLRYDFSLRNYEKLARQPGTMLAQLIAAALPGVEPTSNGTHHDETNARMTEQEFAHLEVQINLELQAIDRARAELVAAHDALVVKWAEKSKEPIEESTSYARCGLAKAAENFDVRRGFRFATYAQWWIKTAIKEKKVWAA